MWSRVRCFKSGSILLTNPQSRLSVIVMSGGNIRYNGSVASDAPNPLAWSVDFLKSHTIGDGRVGSTSTWLHSSAIRSTTVGRSSCASQSLDRILSTSGKEEFFTRRYKVGLQKSNTTSYFITTALNRAMKVGVGTHRGVTVLPFNPIVMATASITSTYPYIQAQWLI